MRKEDILAYVAQQHSELLLVAASRPCPHVLAQPLPHPTLIAIAPAAGSYSAERPASPTIAGADEELVTPSRMRLAIAEHMVRSKRTSPHATTVVEVDMTNIAKWLEKNKAGLQAARGLWHQLRAICDEGRVRGHSQVPA